MLVFREGRYKRRSRGLVTSLAALLSSASELAPREGVVTALLHAGELECGLADAESDAHPIAASITDLLACALLGPLSPAVSAKLDAEAHRLLAAHLPEHVTTSVPEGFAYYALHPLDYVEALREAGETPRAAAVIGIRSIGTTLSAVVNAEFKLRRVECGRITVRPSGHPFDRQLILHADQAEWIEGFRRKDATFYLVDEGPGLSGSSFLAVAEALQHAGVPTSHIVLMCSSQPDPAALLAPNAAARWRSFRVLPARPTSQLPSQAKIFFGGGAWREYCFQNRQQWPAGWLQMERLKFLSQDRRSLFRFDGLGSYGETVRARSRTVADGGFGPDCEKAGDGFTRFAFLAGAPVEKISGNFIQHAAEYCAFRAAELGCAAPATDSLEVMARINIERELNFDVGKDFRLEIVRPVIADGKMMLHEWLQPADGSKPLKLDCAAHGDDHFFPGPTDIAWDLAGASIEWKLNESESAELVRRYRHISNDDAQGRLHSYRLAYAAFRMGYTKMAACAMRGSDEEERLWKDYRFYKETLQRLCGEPNDLRTQAAADG